MTATDQHYIIFRLYLQNTGTECVKTKALHVETIKANRATETMTRLDLCLILTPSVTVLDSDWDHALPPFCYSAKKQK